MESGSSSYDVFLSYNRADAPLAVRIATPLQGRGLSVWIDTSQIQPAEVWVEELENGLDASRVYAVVVTPRSFKSEWVKREYYAALAANDSGRRMQIVALLAEPAKLPLFLRTHQYIDFQDPEAFDDSVEELVRLVESRDASPPDEPAEVAADGGDAAAELDYLREALRHTARDIRTLRIARAVASVLGIPLYLAAVAVGWAPASVALALGGTLFVGLIGWAVTSPSIKASAGRANRVRFLLRKFEQCSERADASCDDLKPEFWRIVHE